MPGTFLLCSPRNANVGMKSLQFQKLLQTQRDVGIVQFWDYFPWGDAGRASLASSSWMPDHWEIKNKRISKFLQVGLGQVRDWIKPTFYFSLIFLKT